MKNKLFKLMQDLGRSFMLPVAVLPAAGILLGLGSSFTNLENLERLGLYSLMGPGSILFNINSVMAGVGSAIFDNLPLIFAIGVAIGMAKKDKEIAGLAAALAYLVMNITINCVLTFRGLIESPNGITTSLGITTLQMGVFGGIVVGVGVSLLTDKFRDIVLPNYLAFFGGNRFVPIISVFVYILVGFVFSYLWPPIQNVVIYLGELIAGSGLIGVFLFAFVQRLLIPFGLHHLFYMPFWQSALGGSMKITGNLYVGAQNILFAQLADPNTTHISREAAKYFVDGYPYMIFVLPVVCYVVYKNAKKENQKETKSLMISAALTSAITGITEPIEFPIVFASPVLYLCICILVGLGNVALYLTNTTVGCTFSDGLIDLILLGILPGNSKTSWIWIIPIGVVMALIAYIMVDFMIKKFDLKTPGREEKQQLIKVNALSEDASDLITNGLGGKDNIETIGCCATRLRVSLKDASLISQDELRNTGALGITLKENAIQVIYGPGVNLIKNRLEEYLNSKTNNALIRSPLVGKYIKMEDVPDETFAHKMLGDGVAVLPEKDLVTAPADGKIDFVYPTKHAIGFSCNNGVKMIIHLGIDTVELNGQGFESYVKDGDEVKMGAPLMKMDLDFLNKNAKSMISPIIIVELKNNEKIEIIADEHIDFNESIIRVVR